MTWRALAAAPLLLAAIAVADPPRVLIVQSWAPVSRGNDPNLAIAAYVAAELEEDGRVTPFVWSLADPHFRDATEKGILLPYNENPDEPAIREAAKRLKAEYILMVMAVVHNERVHPSATLYPAAAAENIWHFGPDADTSVDRITVLHNGKKDDLSTAEYREILGDTWKNSATMTVYVEGRPDWDSTSRSVARTWSRLLAQKPFKKHPPRPKMTTPDPTPGLGGRPPGSLSGVDAKAVQEAIERSAKYLAAGAPDMAILVLRDAVDLNPFDMAPRRALAQALFGEGLYREAAEEARRASLLAENPADMSILAAQAWLLADQPSEAKVDLTSALARGLDSPESWIALGNVHLMHGEPDKAITQFSKAIDAGSGYEARAGRAIAHAALGEPEACARDLDGLKPAEGPLGIQQYRIAMRLVERQLPGLLDELRGIIQGVRSSPTDQSLEPRAKAAADKANSLATLVGRFPAPALHASSHEARDLAHKLLVQASMEARLFVRDRNENVGAEAAISLGEALKILPVIREKFEFERKPKS